MILIRERYYEVKTRTAVQQSSQRTLQDQYINTNSAHHIADVFDGFYFNAEIT